jgi:hypothetical protein
VTDTATLCNNVYTPLLQVIDMVGEAKLAPAHARKRLGSDMTAEAKVLLLTLLPTSSAYCIDTTYKLCKSLSC